MPEGPISEGRLSDGLLSGVRIVESSMLGPAELGGFLADLGADVIKIEPPGGDYGRRMTWPIVMGTSLLRAAHQPGQALGDARPAQARGRRGLPRPRARRRRRHRSHAARRARPARAHVRAHAGGEPQDRVLHDLGLRRDRSLQGHAVARHRVRHVGRHVRARVRRRGFCYIPDHASMGIHAGPLMGAFGIVSAILRARTTGHGCQMEIAQSDAAAYMDWYRIETWKSYERPAGRGHRQRHRQLRAARARYRGHAGRRPVHDLRVVRRPRAVHGVGAGVLEELLRGHRPDGPVRAVAGREVRRPRPQQPRAAGDPARHLPLEDERGVDRVRQRAQHADRAVQLAEDDHGRPAVPGIVSRGIRRRSSWPTSCRSR